VDFEGLMLVRKKPQPKVFNKLKLPAEGPGSLFDNPIDVPEEGAPPPEVPI
jgi:hypothetical protein